MVITSGNCIIPLAVWNRHCPQHSISCILMTPDKKHLITGATDGHIIKWDIDDNWKLTPVFLLLGHETRVTNLCFAYEDDKRSYFVSSTETGEMCLWDMHNGRCVLHKTNSRFIHTSIQSHIAAVNHASSGSTSNVSCSLPRGKMRLLFCCGRYPMLVVLEALSLTPLFHLSSRSNPTRFTALTVFSYPGQPTDVVLGLSANQAVTVWTVGSSDNWPSAGTAQDGSKAVAPPSQKFENESRTIKCEGGQIICMSCCPKNPRTVLIISQRTWQVHDAVDWCLLCSHSVESESEKATEGRIEWTDGQFVSLDTVLIHSSDGASRMYKLPVCAIAGQENFRQMNDKRSPHLIATFESQLPIPFPTTISSTGFQDNYSDSSSLSSPEDGERCFVETSRFAFLYDSRILIRGDAHGRLLVWLDFPDTLNGDGGSSYHGVHENIMRIQARAGVSLEQIWAAAKPRGLVDCLLPHDSSGVRTAVTASAFAQTPGKLVIGLDSGEILVASILDCLAHVFFSSHEAMHGSSNPGPPCHMRLSGGHSRTVTTLCYPANRVRGSASGGSSSGDYPPEVLVSGGKDFTVRLWDLNTGSHLISFSGHGAPIMAIVSTPEQCSKRTQECVCCMAADHSVSLINVRERKVLLMANLQPQPLSVIKWRPLEDFMLVGCVDGSVFVWETTSGHLDRYLPPGPAATAALNGAEHPYHVPTRVYKRHGCSMDCISTILCTDGKASGSVGGGRMRIAGNSRIPVRDLRPLKVQSIRGESALDQDWHILFFDTEALVAKLLSEEAARHVDDKSSTVQSRLARASSPARPQRPGEPPRRATSPRPGGRGPPPPHPSLNPGNTVGQQLVSRMRASLMPNQSDQRNAITSASQTSRLRGNSSSSNPAEHTGDSAEMCDDTDTAALELAILLVSLIHAWDLDPGLDRTGVSTLGLVKPRRPVHYGSVSQSNGFICLYMPQVRSSPSRVPDGVPGGRTGVGCDNPFPQIQYWAISSILTTQHLLTIVSLSNTLMQIVDGSKLRQWPMLSERMCISCDGTDGGARQALYERLNSNSSSATLGGVKQSWSLLTAHHCVLLPELAPKKIYNPPKLETLARKWQDRCIEIRQAAQALLLSELRRIGTQGRQGLLSRWSVYLPLFTESTAGTQSSIASVGNVERLRLSSIGSLDEELSSLQLQMQQLQGQQSDQQTRRSSIGSAAGSISNGVANIRSGFVESQRLQALAVVLLGVIGAEFGGCDSGEPSRTSALEGFGRDDYHLARRICKALIALVLPGQAPTQTGPGNIGGSSGSGSHGSSGSGGNRASHASNASGGSQPSSLVGSTMSNTSMQLHTAMRRAAMDLFGRGFAVWEPYIDVTALLTALLDYSLASASSSDEIEQIITSGGSLSPSADTARTARHALDLIASSRPRVFILTLSREVKRYNSVAANSQLAGSSAPTAMAIYAARGIILTSLETLCEKRVVEVSEVIGEVIEVLLHCLEYSSLKEWPLRELFPQISRFPNVSSSSKTQKIAVGTRTGALFLYDFKQGKFNTVPIAHSGPIACLSFHINGKHVASFSTADNFLRVWQLGTANLFGMLGTQLRCVTQRPLHASVAGERVAVPDVRGAVYIEWLDNRTVAIYSSVGMVDKMRVL